MAILNSPFVTNVSLAALNAEQVLAVDGCNTVSIQLSNTYVGTIVAEGTGDGTNFFPIHLYRDGFGFQPLTLASAATGAYYGSCSMFRLVRVRMSAYTSGTATCSISASTAIAPALATPRSADLLVTVTAVAGATATLTLPAATGLLHYISHISVENHKAATVTAQTTPILVTTTNLNSLVMSMPNEGVAGSGFTKVIEPKNPIRSQVAGTATTIVFPAVTSVIPRMTAHYYTGL
jgi:hypothetical protein